ncbi:Amidohydrolase 2 [Candidatus Magnetomorum sp. HK-1]|nr:Amidohydrolase 2 [Candidatus Magnetomorum sp. HK-1]
MIIDCHFHLETRILDLSELIQKMEECHIDKVALIPTMVDPFPEPKEILLRLLQKLLKSQTFRPLARLLCSNFTKQGDIQILSKSYHIYPEPDNETIFDVIDRYPDHFFGWIFINPKSNQNIESEIFRWIDHPNCVGIKAHPFWHRYPPSELIPAAKIATQKEKPMLLHLGFDAHGDFKSLIQAVPEVKLILAHAAFPEFSDIWKTIKSFSNVYVDISQTSYVNEQTIKDVVNFLGPEKCLFGTDGPYGSMGKDGLFDFNVILKQVKQIFPEADIQKKILGENFQSLIKP